MNHLAGVLGVLSRRAGPLTQTPIHTHPLQGPWTTWVNFTRSIWRLTVGRQQLGDLPVSGFLEGGGGALDVAPHPDPRDVRLLVLGGQALERGLTLSPWWKVRFLIVLW